MGLFTINRQTANKLGTGLPFMLKTRYQERYNEVTSTEPRGYWQVPQNKLPTLQVWSDFELTKIELIQVIQGVDQPAIEIDIANFEQRCTSAPDNKRIYYTVDEQRDFMLDCGLWYFALEFQFGARPSYYSELFEIGGVCAYAISLAYVVDRVNIDDSVDVTFTINHSSSSNILSYSSTVNAVPYATKSFSVLNIADGVPAAITIELDGNYCGTFAQDYTFLNNGGLIFSLTKNY